MMMAIASLPTPVNEPQSNCAVAATEDAESGLLRRHPRTAA
jgi:hypothetical protein